MLKMAHLSPEEICEVQKKAKQAMQDIERDELDHDNVEHIVILMILAGYEKQKFVVDNPRMAEVMDRLQGFKE